MESLEEFGLKLPEILLPKDKNLGSWSVIACDQYTQDEGYWKRAEVAAGGRPSTLNLILPEVYLSRPDKADRIARIKRTMADYLSGGKNKKNNTNKCFFKRIFNSITGGLKNG